MFVVDCPRHRTRVLLGPRRIARLENTPDGILVRWRCFCGATGRTCFGGRAHHPRPEAS